MMPKFIVVFIVFAFSSDVWGQNAVASLDKLRKKADIAYQDGRYVLAYRLYKALGEVGDKFSAYRIATMYSQGLHVDKDPIKAYAWSYLAAETGGRAFRRYHDNIKQGLTDLQLEDARIRAAELIQEYGIYANAVKTKETLRELLSQCAGSRVGNTCNKISVKWGGCGSSLAKNPLGNMGEREPPVSCLRIGIIGLASYNVMPSTIRDAQKALDMVIDQYQPGRVELGDFELIENAPADQGGQVQADDG